MNQIKIINTGKCEIIAVKVPEGEWDYQVMFDGLICFVNTENLFTLKITIPEGNWQIGGIQTELTEEQWREIVQEITFGKNTIQMFRNYTKPMPQCTFALKTAKESGLSLMQANQCYSVNPYGGEPDEISTPLSWDSEGLEADFIKWQEAEANTGTWLILKKLSNEDQTL